jgi:chemotaxis protein methyltransferase CheR
MSSEIVGRERSMDIPESANDKDFPILKRKIFSDTSLDCNQYKDNYLKRRIAVRMHVNKVPTYREYIHLLTRDPDEYSELLSDLTINVTQFFRDPEVFRILEEEFLPLLIYHKVKSGKRVIRIWSAGCASGEEPYSLAILMHDLLGSEIDNFIVTILGTDIDSECLEAAKIGEYLPRQIENVRLGFLNSYFTYDGEMYQLSDDIIDMVRFKKLDLFSDIKGGNFDLILCRNVIIYFTKQMQQRLFENFYDSLNWGGYMVLGKTETLLGDTQRRFEAVNTRERVYQKNKDYQIK